MTSVSHQILFRFLSIVFYYHWKIIASLLCGWSNVASVIYYRRTSLKYANSSRRKKKEVRFSMGIEISQGEVVTIPMWEIGAFFPSRLAVADESGLRRGSKTIARRSVVSIRRGQEFYCQADNGWGVLPSSRYHDSREFTRKNMIYSTFFLLHRDFASSFHRPTLSNRHVKSDEHIVPWLSSCFTVVYSKGSQYVLYILNKLILVCNCDVQLKSFAPKLLKSKILICPRIAISFSLCRFECKF